MEEITNGTCPVCKVSRKGIVDPRQALQRHLKQSRDPDHILWVAQHYKTYFARGGDKSKIQPNEEMIKAAIEKAFGSEWSAKLVFT